ncbi:hypothetical protein LTR10_010858 [Elasticomyces elasticus]|nr:hypothetical protein LTR10_010858 [Elasticomyces elasticus]
MAFRSYGAEAETRAYAILVKASVETHHGVVAIPDGGASPPVCARELLLKALMTTHKQRLSRRPTSAPDRHVVVRIEEWF